MKSRWRLMLMLMRSVILFCKVVKVTVGVVAVKSNIFFQKTSFVNDGGGDGVFRVEFWGGRS